MDSNKENGLNFPQPTDYVKKQEFSSPRPRIRMATPNNSFGCRDAYYMFGDVPQVDPLEEEPIWHLAGSNAQLAGTDIRIRHVMRLADPTYHSSQDASFMVAGNGQITLAIIDGCTQTAPGVSARDSGRMARDYASTGMYYALDPKNRGRTPEKILEKMRQRDPGGDGSAFASILTIQPTTSGFLLRCASAGNHADTGIIAWRDPNNIVHEVVIGKRQYNRSLKNIGADEFSVAPSGLLLPSGSELLYLGDGMAYSMATHGGKRPIPEQTQFATACFDFLGNGPFYDVLPKIAHSGTTVGLLDDLTGFMVTLR